MLELLEKLDINYKNLSLYEQAFIHTSYAYEHNLNYSYETLEFLGDAIVDLVVSDYLYHVEKYSEGEMTKIRASYVCENALSLFADDLGFSKCIKVGRGEYKSGGTHKKAILADVFEAFIAAIYLDLGFEKAKDVLLSIVVPYIEDENVLIFNDYKTALQEAVQTVQKSVCYETVNEYGPAHDKIFKVVCKVEGIVFGEGVGSSKKEAEQNSAKSALAKIAKKWFVNHFFRVLLFR